MMDLISIISDTVGLYTDLPMTLIAAFKSTLEEAKVQIYLVHVGQISSHPEYRMSMTQLNDLIKQLDT
ncbi:hypothetical protein UM582_12655 [Staphylococcus aureus]|nr:hypothetical protein UM582_12655 [Staphylococcus aureus]